MSNVLYVNNLEKQIAENEKRYDKFDRMHKEASRQLVEERDELRQQLAAALAACKVKDESLEGAHNGLRWWMDAFPLHVTEADNEEMLKLEEALAIQPDDAALKEWLGEPVGYKHETSGGLSCLNTLPPSGQIGWITTPLYAPKGMK